MLPDFPEAKQRIQRRLLRWVQEQIPRAEPVLAGISRFRQHEGRAAELTRADASTVGFGYEPHAARMELGLPDLRRPDVDGLRAKLLAMAEEFAGQQASLLIRRVGEAADSVGNTVDARGELTADAWLDVFRKVQLDFDPETGDVSDGFAFLMHPDTAAALRPRVAAWEADPAFAAEYQRIIDRQRDAWRDRESRRKLAD